MKRLAVSRVTPLEIEQSAVGMAVHLDLVMYDVRRKIVKENIVIAIFEISHID